MLYEVGTAGPVQTLWLANNDGGGDAILFHINRNINRKKG